MTTDDDNAKLALEQRFAPFVRVSPPWTPYEVVKTTLMTIFILPFRLLFLLSMLVFVWLISKVSLIGVSDPDEYRNKPLPVWKRRFVATLAPLTRATLAFSFGIWKIEKEQSRAIETNEPRIGTEKTVVIAANHLGYLDIAVLYVVYKGAFVAKGGISRTPFMGAMATAIQCLFVNETHGGFTSQLIDRVQNTHNCHEDKGGDGRHQCLSTLIIFPEGTTTNGTAMVQFRTGVFNAGLPVRPVAVRFPHSHFNPSWETILFKEHLWRTMTQFVNRVQLIECPVYSPSAEERADSKLFANNVQATLGHVLEQKIFPLNRKHKMAYHSCLLGKRTAEEALVEADKITERDPLLGGYRPCISEAQEVC